MPPLPLSRQNFVDTRNPYDDDLRIAETESHSNGYERNESENDDEKSESDNSTDASNVPTSGVETSVCESSSAIGDSIQQSISGIESASRGASQTESSPGQENISRQERTASDDGFVTASPDSSSRSSNFEQTKTQNDALEIGEDDDETLKDCFEIYNVENFLSEKLVTTCTAMRYHRYLVADRDRTRCIVVSHTHDHGSRLVYSDMSTCFDLI